MDVENGHNLIIEKIYEKNFKSNKNIDDAIIAKEINQESKLTDMSLNFSYF
jgi:hypothetical protein